MKKGFVLSLVLVLLLTGCAGPQPESVEITREPSHLDGGLYVSDSEVEQHTGGAVKYYALPEGSFGELLPLGENLLLVCSGEEHHLELLVGETLANAVQAELPCPVTAKDGSLQVGQQGVAYWNQPAGALVFLNASLREISRLQMPADMIGIPWLAPSWEEVYYCTDEAVKVLDMKTGISRTLREQQKLWQSVTGVLAQGSIVRCETESADGTREVFLMDAQTGERLKSGAYLAELTTSGENWYCKMESAAVAEYLIGSEQALWNLWPADKVQKVLPLPERNAVITCREIPEGCRLEYYDGATGKRSASVDLPGLQEVTSACTHGETGKLWLLAQNASEKTQGIYCWTPDAIPTGDSRDYRAVHYTRDNPDTAGLEALGRKVESLEKNYGITLLLGEAPLAVAPEGYSLETEYLVQAYDACLPLLENALSQFPEGFFQTLARRTNNKTLTVCLVRSIRGMRGTGTLSETSALQYWKQGDAYLALALGEDLERNFYHGIMHAIETRVLSVSTVFYDWERLNPEGFSYTNGYGKNPEGEQYLQEGQQWFANAFAMSYAREDRASTMEYACTEGNQGLFQSPHMQKKLQMLCKGIRQAFGLQDREETFLWEQYLREE